MDPISIGLLVVSALSSGYSLYQQNQANVALARAEDTAIAKQTELNDIQKLAAQAEVIAAKRKALADLQLAQTAARKQADSAQQLATVVLVLSGILAAVVLIRAIVRTYNE